MFLDYTCSTGHSMIYSNFLFIYYFFVKKKKEKRKSPQIGFANCNALTLTTSYLPCSSLFIVTHFFPYINIHILKLTKKKKIQIEVYMTSQSINSETKTIPKLNTYKTKQRIKQITSKLLYIYIYTHIYI